MVDLHLLSLGTLYKHLAICFMQQGVKFTVDLTLTFRKLQDHAYE